MSTRILALTSSLMLFGFSTVLADGSAHYSSYHAGKRFTFTITSEMQARCPKWDPQKSENPPLSAAKALSIAKQFIAGIKADGGYKWEFQDLALVDVYGWAWRAQFQQSWQQGASSGPPRLMQCWILMDGTLVRPTITAEK